MKTIALKFAGPMQSWGTTAHFNVRHTDLYPSKSGVVGLIAASLGYRRQDIDLITPLKGIDFAVRIDQVGTLATDYQTVTRWDKLTGVRSNDNKYKWVTERYYLEDAIFIVAISHTDEALVEQILEALKRPYFQPYMGRRSTPVPREFIIDVYPGGVISALESIQWQAAKWYRRKHSGRLDVYADAHLIDNGRVLSRKDNVLSFDQKHRQFQYREECHFLIDVPNDDIETEHDPFAILEGGLYVSFKSSD